MKELRIGCSGWSYKGWVGPLYPPGTKPGDFLALYSKLFNTVEIDSTFYAPPADFVIEKWLKSTPDGFIFCPKLPGLITHENKLNGVDVILEKSLLTICRLKPKLGPILVQLPPSLTYENGIESLSEFLPLLPGNLDFAIEFRNNSWFNETTFGLLRDHDVILSWSEIPMAKNPTIMTSKDVYLRLVGDRTIQESQFGTIQKKKEKELEHWAGALKEKQDEIEKAYVYSNNHFQGFGPGTVNLFRVKMGLPEIDFNRLIAGNNKNTRQRTLF